jgi:DNA modification methylase
MGKAWDSTGIAYNVELWRECLRVLKPGGHLLAFGATRSYHRMAVAIEDAGFEIRDSIHWTYGSGFPKSLDVSKAIDKQRDERDDIYRVTAWVREARDAAGKTNKDIDTAFGFAGMAGHWTSQKSQPTVPTLEQVPVLLETLGLSLDEVPENIRELLWTLNGNKGQPGAAWFAREVTGQHAQAAAAQQWQNNVNGTGDLRPKERRDIPATDNARTWAGWGTALKPSHEPIVVARKPIVGTVASNVLQFGTGALNIDANRVGSEARHNPSCASTGDTTPVLKVGFETEGRSITGRWPANTVLTHAADCKQTGKTITDDITLNGEGNDNNFHGNFKGGHDKSPKGATTPVFACVPGCPVPELDKQSGPAGAAARFFTQTEWADHDWLPFCYMAKPGKKERNAGLDGLKAKSQPFGNQKQPVEEGSVNDKFRTAPASNFHPTVKPVELMRYLIKLVTPAGGTVLDPFLGSGTTAVAAELDRYKWVGCELTNDYLAIIQGRVQHANQQRESQLFG